MKYKFNYHDLICVLILLLLLILYSSLLLQPNIRMDEFGSIWVISGDFRNIFDSFQYGTGQSLLYSFVLWTIKTYVANSIHVFRLFSLLAILLSALLLKKIAVILFPKFSDESNLLPLLFLSEARTIYTATEVRPYPLAILFSVCSTLYLVKACKSKLESEYLFIYGIFYSLMLYCHLLFSIIIIPQLITVALLTSGKIELRALCKKLLITCCLMIFLSIPLYGQISYLTAISNKIIVMKDFTFEYLFAVLKIEVMVLVFFFLLFVLFRSKLILKAKYDYDYQISNEGIVVLSYYIIPFVILFLISWTTGANIFVPRYFSYTVAFKAFIIFLVFCSVDNSLWYKLILYVYLVSISIFYTYNLISFTQEGWVEAAKLIKDSNQRKECPILYNSFYIEANYLDLINNDKVNKFITYPIKYFGLANKLIMLPNNCKTEDNIEYLKEQLQDLQRLDVDCFWLYSNQYYLPRLKNCSLLKQLLENNNIIKSLEFEKGLARLNRYQDK
ncbi:MAG: hypothetical protein KBC84_00205 [Proteobacteria bacterium]|nr:hypothetical protein [Pseudomonadota bacterium]